MATETEQWIASWQSTREKGIWLFLLKLVLVFGVTRSLFNALDWALDGRPFKITRVLIDAVFLGVGVGAFLWFWRENKYRERTSAKSQSDA